MPQTIQREPNGPSAAASVQLYDTRQLCGLIGCNRTTLWRMCKEGRFPEPLRVMAAKPLWPATDYDRWLATQIAMRDAAIQDSSA